MKIAIFGKNSYIGKSFKNYWNTKYPIEFIDSRNEFWEGQSFSEFDVVMYVAGIAHVSTNIKYKQLYYRINTELAIKVANKAKNDHVKQFIYLSSIIVYGDDLTITSSFIINRDTIPNPSNFYGSSKLHAENELLKLNSPDFCVSILRLPMVYGRGCKGNFPRLVNIARFTPFFPEINNQKSMIYIENLSIYIEMCIRNKIYGIQFPQNTEYVNTLDIIHLCAKYFNRTIYFSKILNSLIIVLSKKNNILRKMFGSRVYDRSLSIKLEEYNKYSFEESIILCCEEIRDKRMQK